MRGVKSTTSANRTDAAVNWSAMVLGLDFSRSAIEPGRMFSSRLSARSCSIRSAASASARCFANSARSVNTIVPPTAMFSASIRLENHSGSGDWVPSTTAARPEPRNSASHATNHRIAAPTPTANHSC